MKQTIISEYFRSLSMKGFELTGDYREDAIKFCRAIGKIPSKEEELLPILSFRLALGEPMTVYRITEAVCKKILPVKLDFLPNEYPAFLKTPLLVEAKPGNNMFDDIFAIGTYIDDKSNFYFIAFTDTGTLVCYEKNPFSQGKLLADMLFDNTDNPEQVLQYKDKKKEVFRFITILALMLEAEKSPIIAGDSTKKAKKRNLKDKKIGQSDWIERRIFIDAKYIQKKKSSLADSVAKDDKTLKEVPVQAYLRRQHYGPNNELTKVVYIEDFKSSRWKKTGNTRITIDSYFA